MKILNIIGYLALMGLTILISTWALNQPIKDNNWSSCKSGGIISNGYCCDPPPECK